MQTPEVMRFPFYIQTTVTLIRGQIVLHSQSLQNVYSCLFLFLTFLFPLAALVMVLNSTSVSWSARIQIFLTFCKLVAILIIIVPGVIQLIKGMK